MIVGRLFGCLTVVFRLYEGSQAFDGRLSSAVSRSYFVCMREARRLTVVCLRLSLGFCSFVGRLSVISDLLIVCPSSYGCLSVASRLSVGRRTVVRQLPVGRL